MIQAHHTYPSQFQEQHLYQNPDSNAHSEVVHECGKLFFHHIEFQMNWYS